MNNDPIKIDIVSDVACPWCYIGKKHLEKALENFNSPEVAITWHPFQLDPTIPKEGVSREEYFAKKFGSNSQIEAVFQRVAGVGEQAGIIFNFHQMSKAINTIPLHKLLHIAREEGTQIVLEERFFKGYFTDGIDFSDDDILFTFMQDFGWDAEKTTSILANDEIEQAVLQEIQHFQNLGVSGVPFFIFNNKYAVSGAQPTNVFLDTLQKVVAEIPPLQTSADACKINGDNC